jgi:hypothetical protein
MHTGSRHSGPQNFALIRRYTLTAATFAFIVLFAVCVLVWVAFGCLIIYQSLQQNVSPIEVLRIVGTQINILRDLYWSLGIIVAGTAFCAFVGAVIGAIATAVNRSRRR